MTDIALSTKKQFDSGGRGQEEFRHSATRSFYFLH